MNHEPHEPHEWVEPTEPLALIKVCEPVESTDSLLYRDEVFAIQGAIFEVNRVVGCGFLESVYQECLEHELAKREIPFEAQRDLELCYKDRKLAHTFKADLVCYDKIIIELKAVKEIRDEHRAQLVNYLKATRFRLGLLVNFNHYPKALIERIFL
jgi:GxxExxY protein